MIDNTAQKMTTRFVVVREFAGAQSMEDAFGALVERQAGESYERWKNDHADAHASPPTRSENVADKPDMAQSDDVNNGVMNIMTPMSAQGRSDCIAIFTEAEKMS